MARIFTVEEAEALIPELDEVVKAIEFHRMKIRDNERKLEVLDLLWGGDVDDPSNPDYDAFRAYKRLKKNDTSEIERIVQEQIVRRGITVPPGGIENRILDFPSVYEGREVFLCWQKGEPKILCWHEADEGCRTRRRMTEEEKRTMGKREGEGQ